VAAKKATTILQDESPPCARDPRWSPTGSTILFGRHRNLFTIRADGTDQTKVTTFSTPGHVSGWDWSPDGAQIVFARRRSPGIGRIFVMDANGTNITRIARCRPRTCAGQRTEFPMWSPDGNAIAFAQARDIQLIAPDGSQPRTLTTCPSRFDQRQCTIAGIAWSPNSKRIAFTRWVRGVWIIPSDRAGTGHRTSIKRGYVLAWRR
jgi:dipeptidyl aminopeptidase/acylaminoacyl peptidase